MMCAEPRVLGAEIAGTQSTLIVFWFLVLFFEAGLLLSVRWEETPWKHLSMGI